LHSHLTKRSNNLAKSLVNAMLPALRNPMSPSTDYRGASPLPHRPAAFRSLVAAIGSYLDAKHHHGTWLVRMEDLDVPRCVPVRQITSCARWRRSVCIGMASQGGLRPPICRAMARPTVLYQSQRTAAYEETLQILQAIVGVSLRLHTQRDRGLGAAWHRRASLSGTCRNGIPAGREERAWRAQTNHPFLPLAGGRPGWG